jgi:hypothetical protein
LVSSLVETICIILSLFRLIFDKGILWLQASSHPGTVADLVGTVLLMRVRRASEKQRRTQVQIPIRIYRQKFFQGISGLISAHDGRKHPIIRASARGGLNTMKVELPEIESFNDPVVSLERTGPEIVYQTFDAKSLLGYPIIQALHEGIETGQTSLTVPDVDHATRTYACLF